MAESRHVTQRASGGELDQKASNSPQQPDVPLDTIGGHLDISKQTFSWEDLEFLRANNFALRHVSTWQQAASELQHGVAYGDAVSLACPQNQLLAEKNLPQIFQLLQIRQGLSMSYSAVPMALVPEDLRIVARLNFADSLKAFFEHSIAMDLGGHHESKADVSAAISELEMRGSSFLVGCFQGAQDPYDIEGYFALGKCGKQDVSPANLKGALSLRGFCNRLSSAGGLDLNAPIDRESLQVIAKSASEYLWGTFLDRIRTLRELSVPES